MMERQLRLVEDEILLPPIQVRLDNIDKMILSIFRKHPGKKWKVSQISPILFHSGLDVGYNTISRRLNVMCLLTILAREKNTGKVYRYFIPGSF
jgi:hypothetical protein